MKVLSSRLSQMCQLSRCDCGNSNHKSSTPLIVGGNKDHICLSFFYKASIWRFGTTLDQTTQLLWTKVAIGLVFVSLFVIQHVDTTMEPMPNCERIKRACKSYEPGSKGP